MAELRDTSGLARKSSTESIEPERRGKEKSSSFETRSVVAISGGHFTHDSYTAFLPSLLPLLIERLSLSLTMAGSLALFLQLPSLLNPVIGHLADRIQSRLFVVLAPGVTATFMVFLGMSESYFQLIFLLLCAGLSVASFHAPAPALVARVSGDRVGRGMSFFMTGGELGRTVGPVLAAWAVSRWGLEGIYPLALFGWFVSFWLYLQLPRLARGASGRDLKPLLKAARALLGPVLTLLIARGFSISSVGLFLPTLLKSEGSHIVWAAAALSIYELAGGVGAFLSGTISDHLGRRPILLISVAASGVLMMVLVAVKGWMMVPVLICLGFVSLATQPVMLAMIQDQFPDRRAVANGVYLALSFIIRPLAALIIGIIGDSLGLRAGFAVSGVLLLLSLPMVRLLPR